jgi:allantoicase
MDALGMKRPGLFVEHVRWYAGFWPRRKLSCDYPVLLEALEAALARDAALSEMSRTTVATGRTALKPEPS